MESTEYSENIDFQQYWSALKRRWLPALAVWMFVVGLSAMAALKQKPVYEAQGKLLIKTNATSSLTGLGEKVGELNALNKDNNPVDTEVQVINSIPIAERTIAALKLKDKKGNYLKSKDFLEGLSVKSLKGTDVLRISYKNAVPKKAASVVNTLMKIYIENNELINRAETTAAAKFIAQQLPLMEDSVRQAAAALRDFKETNKIVSVDKEEENAARVIADLDTKIAEAQAKLADTTAKSVALRDKLAMEPQEAITVNSPLSESTGVKTALEDLQKVENQLAAERSRFQEEHPAIINLERKRTALKALLKQRVSQTLGTQQSVTGKNLQLSKVQEEITKEFVQSEAERLGTAKQVDSLIRVQAAYVQRANVLPRLEKMQRELERKLEASQSTYDTLLKKLQEVRVTEKQNFGNARIIENALVPESPVGPGKSTNLAIGGILGALLAVSAVITLELADKSIRTVKQARNQFGYPLLGSIPAFRTKAKGIFLGRKSGRLVPAIPVRDTPRSRISEAYQMLQANLSFLSSDRVIRVIVVTSSVSKEGRSTVSANLAAVMAQLGHQVLLIDADLRCPSQHHLWELPNTVGLSDIIVEQGEFRTAVKEVMPNLDVLSSGMITSNPIALIDSRRMTLLIKNLSNNYDFVIIDTPPLYLAPDAAILGKISDGVLLVVQPGVVDSTSATASKELLEQSSQQVLGLVVNGVTLENKPDRSFDNQSNIEKKIIEHV